MARHATWRELRHATWCELRHSTWCQLRHSLGSRRWMQWMEQSQHFQVFSKPTICVTLHPIPFVQMWHHVTWQTDTNALEETANSTLRVEVPVLKIQARNSSKMLVIYLQDDWSHKDVKVQHILWLWYQLTDIHSTTHAFYKKYHTSMTDACYRTPGCLSPIYGKKKGKAIPLQAWTGPEGSRRLRLPDFKTIGTWRR